MKILGHPIHLMLIHFPSALLPMDFICSVLAYYSGDLFFVHASFYAMVGGVFVGGLAIVTGAFDLISLIKDKPEAIKKALIHGGINTTVIIIYFVLTALTFKKYPQNRSGWVIQNNFEGELASIYDYWKLYRRKLDFKIQDSRGKINNMVKKIEQYTDLEIIDRIKFGEAKLYEILIRRNNSYLFKVGRAYGYNHHDTEDLMQETYISAFYDLPKFENRSSFKTWITRIMLNHCFQRKQKFSFQKESTAETVKTEIAEPMFHNHSNTEKTIVNKELGHILEGALNRLPEDYRMVFTLRELNGLSISETTEVLNISESNVKVRLNRAKKMLRLEIEKLYSPEDIFEFNLVFCNSMVERVMSKIEIQDKL